MKNVKDIVYAAISGVVENTTDSYPSNFENLPAVQYVEDENRIFERIKNQESKAQVRYVVDIWDRKSTSQTAVEIDAAVSLLGLVRTSCKDVPEQGGLKHKHMVYEGIIDMHSDTVYWNY